MKAYVVRWKEDTGYSTVVFANDAKEAKKAAMWTDFWEDSDQIFTDLRVTRIPELDAEYRGHSEMDWNDTLDRIALCKCGWHCESVSDACDLCCARDYCDHWEKEDWEED